MASEEHSRVKIWSAVQHPLKHTLSDFGFVNPALPGVSNIEAALNYILAVLFPQTQAAVATVGDLPALGNTINDMRVVLDDGDGKAASYRWEQREGEASPSWHKIYDMDFGVDSIMEYYLNQTQDLYVFKGGSVTRDASGAVITGTFAGQRIFGGSTANTNLTLSANSGDGMGSPTGYVQVTDNFRPTASNSFDLGTATEKFKTLYLETSALISTMTLSAGSIVDSSGAINFGSNDFDAVGVVNADKAHLATELRVDSGGNALFITTGSITSNTGAISFDNENLSTTGTITAGDITISSGMITATGGSIDFDGIDLTNINSLSAGSITAAGSATLGNLYFAGYTITTQDLNQNVVIVANGTGVVDVQSTLNTLSIAASGTVGITGQLNIDNLRLDGNVISSTNLNGNITMTPNGTGVVEVSSSILPSADDSVSVGSSIKRFSKAYVSQAISDGTTEITQATLQSFRDANVGVSAGMTLFWDGTKWSPSIPDSEIQHSTLSGLITGDAGHTQFVMLAGRSGGQTIQGGVAASENLVLESTAHATKGAILVKDKITPFTDASYSGGWQGTDIGDGTHYFRDIYTKGEAKGLRVENYLFGSLPANSAQNLGRLTYGTDTQKVYVDTGTSWKVVGGSKYINDEVFDGIQTTKNVNVSASISDARTAIWQLLDNANDFDRIYCTIKTTSASNVQIVTNAPLPAGSYRLIGLE